MAIRNCDDTMMGLLSHLHLRHLLQTALVALLATVGLYAADDCTGVHGLRAGGDSSEWSDSPSDPSRELTCTLAGDSIEGPATLLLQHDGVKRRDWRITLDGESLGLLLPDEHKQWQTFEIAAGVLRGSANELRLKADDGATGVTDDIDVRGIRLVEGSVDDWLGAGRVQVRVVDGRGDALPVRITVADAEDSLVPVGAESGGDLAVRTGVVYTSTGAAGFTLPVGEHTIYASRGFEYSVASRTIQVGIGSSHVVELELRHEVKIPGWTAGDTHLHTYERSGHGDATVAEESITVAGEGLDWGVSTEHNLPATLPDVAGEFLSIRGAELTTPYGHFNVFPWPETVEFVDHEASWQELWESLPDGVAAIWNHPRDVHSGYRPFDPSHYIALAAESLDGRVFPGAGMEVVNSSAMYSHPLELVRDWMRHLNRGARISAVGSSDTHTVSIVHVGQARTYVHTREGALTPEAVAGALTRGETAVSLGLVAFLDQGENGLAARVYGPSWNLAKRLVVFANGEVIADFPIEASGEGGLQWEGEVSAPDLKHDAYLAVVAVGDGPYLPYWPLNRPYQAVSSEWTPMTLGVSPAVAWDGNGDGLFENAREIAATLMTETVNPKELAEALADYDGAVVAQVGLLLAREGRLGAVLRALEEGGSQRVRERLEAVAREYSTASAAKP